MNTAIIDFVKDRWPLYLAYSLGKRLCHGKQLMRSPSGNPRLEQYEAELAKWQWLRELVLGSEERRIRRWISEEFGSQIPLGPFKGMKYVACQREFSAATRLGYYEAELHPFIERIIAEKYQRIVNIGCSFGYYAVGLAMRMPDSEILAFDIDPRARDRCARLAAENGVSDRVVIHERFDADMFSTYTNEHTLVICDIEGAEQELLNPAQFRALHACDVLVELHDVYDPSISTDLPERFRTTHDVEIVQEGMHGSLVMPKSMQGMGALERLVACHGAQRWGGTPWALFWSQSRLRMAS